MELGYGIQLEQKQQLSQSQIQSLEILAMDSVELSSFLQNEYLENPLMDCSGEHSMGTATEELRNTYEQALTYGKSYEEMVEEEDRRRKDIPVQDYDLVRNFLLYQLPRNHFSESQWKLMEFMVECLDDSGYFKIPVSEVVEKTGMPVGEVQHALEILRDLEPYGVFQEDLRGCLLKQLEMSDQQGTTTWKIVENYLQDVADGRISNISRSLKISTLEVRKCIEQIARLNPRPMSEFFREHSSYIMPDITFREDDGNWEVELNDDWIEDYRINDYYLRMMKETKDAELAEYFRLKLERVRFVMNSIQQRRQTILSISRAVLERQKDYLERKTYLKPMTMADVAEELGIHASTVSRAIKGKYIQYPGGTILMKSLFSMPVATAQGGDTVGVMQIKEMIRELIREEDKNKPYSDQTIVRMLHEKQVDISRRAVAKYREELGIKGSYDRKTI